MTQEQQRAADAMRDALTQISNWLVCSPLANNDDMAQSFPAMLDVAEAAVQAWDRVKEKA